MNPHTSSESTPAPAANPHAADIPAGAPALQPLVVRRLGVDLSQGFARHWNGGNAFTTAFCNALSMSFPVGEQFFIDAVREGAKHLPDTPQNAGLREVARGFIGQEATHRHLHGLFNAQLERQGLINHWARRAEARIRYGREKLYGTSERPYLHELAITAAYEHYTAIFGDLVLGSVDQPGDWFREADEPLRTLWRWHAAEESEHKSVAFELYQRLGGNHTWRMRWFRYVTFLFAVDAARQTVNNLWHDGTLFKPSTWVAGARFLFGRFGAVWRIAAPARDYRRRDFHPEQQGDPQQATRWLNAHASQWTAVGAHPPQVPVAA